MLKDSNRQDLTNSLDTPFGANRLRVDDVTVTSHREIRNVSNGESEFERVRCAIWRQVRVSSSRYVQRAVSVSSSDKKGVRVLMRQLRGDGA